MGVEPRAPKVLEHDAAANGELAAEGAEDGGTKRVAEGPPDCATAPSKPKMAKISISLSASGGDTARATGTVEQSANT